MLGLVTGYALTYGYARETHRLVRYESGCILRGNLVWDLWGWDYRCSELRRYLKPNPWERALAPLVALEERAIADKPKRSVCELPVMGPRFPSQGFPVMRPSWCEGGLPVPQEMETFEGTHPPDDAAAP